MERRRLPIRKIAGQLTSLINCIGAETGRLCQDDTDSVKWAGDAQFLGASSIARSTTSAPADSPGASISDLPEKFVIPCSHPAVP